MMTLTAAASITATIHAAMAGSARNYQPRTHWLCVSLALVVLIGGHLSAKEPERLSSLTILEDNYPRAFFFRSAEGLAATGMPYDQWSNTFDRLMGIIGKVLEEEVPGRSVYNIDYFTRFKKQHPQQIVLLHYNGNARDPRYQMAERGYFDGHWAYFNGATVLNDIGADEQVSEIRVDNVDLFRTEMGRYRDKNEDIGLCVLGEDGKPDWSRCEQVQLLSIDRQRSVLHVRRACYGSKPRSFLAGKTYAAAHVTEGPWGNRSNLMWYYNYSTDCPRDLEGRSCGEVHAEELARRFLPNGELAAFDGLEFDVLTHMRSTSGGAPGRGVDFDADGKPDNGFVDGVNIYGAGVLKFLSDLRRRLGDDRLILADGHGVQHQRGVGLLNGIESEGWPDLRDAAIEDWSGGLNRHLFWLARGRSPVFNYVNHKFTQPTERPGYVGRPDLPMKTHRLVFAASVFTDSAICYAFAPPAPRGQRMGVWDELWKGREQEIGWLGKPLGPPVRLALHAEDLLQGDGKSFAADLVKRLHGEDVQIRVEQQRLRIEPTSESVQDLRVTLRGAPCGGRDLTVACAASAEPLPQLPRATPRLMHVSVSQPGSLLAPQVIHGMKLRGKEPQPIDAATGAQLAYSNSYHLGEQGMPGYRVHPPYRNSVGMVYWQRDAVLPEKPQLEFFTGMGPKAPGRSDGVVFSVEISPLEDGQTVGFREVFRHHQIESKWIAHKTPLSLWAGKTVRLRFVADPGPKDPHHDGPGLLGSRSNRRGE